MLGEIDGWERGRMVLEFPRPALADDVVLLRPWSDADRSAMVEALDDVEYRRHGLSHGGRYTDRDARQFLLDQARERAVGRAVNLAVVDVSQPGAVLGGVALYDVDPVAGRAGLGYWTAPWARGRGVATRSARLLAWWAHEGLGLVRVELTCGPDNPASQRVAERAGFVREGLLRSHRPFQGGRRDSVVYSRLPDDP